jgi:hypothetical protein
MTEAQTPDRRPEHIDPAVATYLEKAAALGYPNVPAQGRTAGTAHLAAGQGMNRGVLYVSITRGLTADATATPEADDPEPEAGQ